MSLARNLHFSLIIVGVISFNTACSSCARPVTLAPDIPAPVVIPPPASALPFSTREPQTWQAEIAISFSGDGIDQRGQGSQKYFIARDGEKRRTDYALSEKETMSVIENAGAKTIGLREQKKCNSDAPPNNAPVEGESFSDFLTTAWLSGKVPASFEALGKEEIGGVRLNKFRVRFERPGDQPAMSEALVWVDDAIGMPVRTEMFSLVNNLPVKQMTIEFRDLKLSVDPGAFDLPAGCKNVPAKEIQEAARK